MRKKVLLLILASALIVVFLFYDLRIVVSPKVGEYITISGVLEGVYNDDISPSVIWSITNAWGTFLVFVRNSLGEWRVLDGLSSSYNDYYNNYVTIEGVVGSVNGTSGKEYMTIQAVKMGIGK